MPSNNHLPPPPKPPHIPLKIRLQHLIQHLLPQHLLITISLRFQGNDYLRVAGQGTRVFEPWGRVLDDWVVARVAGGVPAVVDAEEDWGSRFCCLVCAVI